METGTKKLVDLLTNTDQYHIPIFQRNYVWEKDDWQRLWDDIRGLAKEDGASHFMGTVVTTGGAKVPGQKYTKHSVIDGQQRLTTLSIFFCAMRTVAKARGFESVQEIEDYFVHRHAKGEDKYKVLLRHRDREHYKNLVDGNLPVKGSVEKAHRFFAESIGVHIDNCKNAESAFNTIKDRAADSLMFALIALGEGENAYKIFESLNNTGRDLSPSDLIRNYVFSKIPDGEAEAFDNGKWRPLEDKFLQKDGETERFDGKKFSQFLRCTIQRIGKAVRPDNISESFIDVHRKHNPEKIVKELRPLSDLYVIIRGKESPDVGIEKSLSLVRELDTGAADPFLLRLFEFYANHKISKDSLIQCIEYTAGFIFRRYICGLSSRGYAKWFCDLCGSINSSSDIKEEVAVFFGGKEWPGNAQFKGAFTSADLYNSKYGWEVLAVLEKFQQHKTEPVSLESCDIEHVMPQSISNKTEWKRALGANWKDLHKEWLHTPGNLTLVGEDYNRDMSNDPYKDKKKELKKSKTSLCNYFCNIRKWDIAAIKKRGDELANIAAQIWQGPPTR